jgi:uridine phosphorylase
MKTVLLSLWLLLNQSYGAPQIHVTLQDNLFVRIPVPKKGVVCSNQGRVERISKALSNLTTYEVPWGPKIYIGDYKDQSFFIASAPVGSGSGLMFTELYSAGAEYIIRYGSDDLKNPSDQEAFLIKVIDETDNLYGYNIASGVPEEEWGKSIFASVEILEALKTEAQSRNLTIETRVCHHLENYHALRTPEKFIDERAHILMQQLNKIKRRDKKESFDMESAVLFRVAKDFDKHAAAVLQTVNKKNNKEGPYEGENKNQALSLEKIFIDYILSALIRIN